MRLPFTCPVCGRKKNYPLTELVEGAILTCPFCRLTLTLRGHMWKDVQREIKERKPSPMKKCQGRGHHGN